MNPTTHERVRVDAIGFDLFNRKKGSTMYGARNFEMTNRFFYKISRLNDFIGQKYLKLKLRSAFVPT